jgi:hypothetical protein
MPQFDISSFFVQLIWLFLLLISFYFLLCVYFLPIVNFYLKVRAKLKLVNTFEISDIYYPLININQKKQTKVLKIFKTLTF